jgi:hypothetical protein
MGSISLPAAIVAGSAISGGAGLLGSMTAGNKAADASREAARIAEQQYQTTRGDLLPFTNAGQNILPALTDAALTRTGGGPDMQAALERTPGYQFQLQQGLKATQSAAAARGLGVSGAALKGAATFATGLADSNYEKRFADLLQLNTAQQGNIQNRYSRLAGVGQLGESAAAGTGAVGANAANTAASATTAAGTAQAAGALGGANSIGNAVNSGINNYLGYQLAQKYLPGGGGGTGGYTGGGAFDPGIPLQSGGYTT